MAIDANINSISKYTDSGFASLASASNSFAQKTIKANVPTQAEKSLRSDNRSLGQENDRLTVENKSLSRTNSSLKSENNSLSQEVYDLQSINQQNEANLAAQAQEAQPQANQDQESRFQENARLAQAQAQSSSSVNIEVETSDTQPPQTSPTNFYNNVSANDTGSGVDSGSFVNSYA